MRGPVAVLTASWLEAGRATSRFIFFAPTEHRTHDRRSRSTRGPPRCRYRASRWSGWVPATANGRRNRQRIAAGIGYGSSIGPWPLRVTNPDPANRRAANARRMVPVVAAPASDLVQAVRVPSPVLESQDPVAIRAGAAADRNHARAVQARAVVQVRAVEAPGGDQLATVNPASPPPRTGGAWPAREPRR